MAVVGAGISGLTCARTLADHGLPVAVFEKSRGVGGRMATRRSDNGVAIDRRIHHPVIIELNLKSWRREEAQQKKDAQAASQESKPGGEES